MEEEIVIAQADLTEIIEMFTSITDSNEQILTSLGNIQAYFIFIIVVILLFFTYKFFRMFF